MQGGGEGKGRGGERGGQGKGEEEGRVKGWVKGREVETPTIHPEFCRREKGEKERTERDKKSNGY